MNKFSVALKKFGGFMKRNAFYFLIVLCIASVAAVIALAVTRPQAGGGGDISIGGGADDNDPVIKPEDPDDDKKPDPDVPQKPAFIAPSNGTVSQDFTLEDYVWNPSLGQGEVHTGIDFKGEDLSVFAAGDGVIKDIGNDELNGNYIVITHSDGYESAYYSLDKLTGLKKGDKVTQGQKLGEMSATQGNELMEGVHLHFEMTKDGEPINPLDVIILEEK